MPSSKRPSTLTRAPGSFAAMADRALARKVLETEAAAILALRPSARRPLRPRGRPPPELRRPRHPHRDGQVGHHLPEDRGHAGQHRHRGVFPSPGRSDPRRSRRHPERRCGRRAVLQRRDRRDPAAARNDPPARRQADRDHRRADLDAGAGRRRRARLQRHRRGLSAEPGADREHHRRPGHRATRWR